MEQSISFPPKPKTKLEPELQPQHEPQAESPTSTDDSIGGYHPKWKSFMPRSIRNGSWRVFTNPGDKRMDP